MPEKPARRADAEFYLLFCLKARESSTHIERSLAATAVVAISTRLLAGKTGMTRNRAPLRFS